MRLATNEKRALGRVFHGPWPGVGNRYFATTRTISSTLFE